MVRKGVPRRRVAGGAARAEVAAEEPAGHLADRPGAAGHGRDGARGALHGVVGVRDGDGPADEAEAGQVVGVVARVEDAFGRDALLLAPLLERQVLAVDAVQDGDVEFAGARGDDGVLLGGEDEQGEPGAAQRGDAEAVAAVHGDEFAALGVDVDAVVGLRAVEVEHDGVDVRAARQRAGAVRVEVRGEEAGALQLVEVVDLQHPCGVGPYELGTAEEAVLVGTEPGDVHRVGRAGLDEVLGAVLAAGAGAAVVVDAVRALVGVLAAAPHEAVEGRGGERGVRVAVHDGLRDAVDVGGEEEGARALHEEDDVGRGAVPLLVRVERVQDRGLAAREVAGQLGGPADDFGPGLAGRAGDRGVVGRDVDVAHVPRGQALAHGADDERDAADGREVLRGHALGASPGGDDGEDTRGHCGAFGG
ncbi:putative transferase [Streptomyces sp. Tu6071]|nr:putative transferase [Streptomyces sp. Tu6071]